MDELSIILKARKFVRDAGIDSIPVDIERFASTVNARIKVSNDLYDDESGQTFPFGGKNIITVNGNHCEERQRFTVLHEIAHIVLELPSQHHGRNLTTSDLISYRQRPMEEVLCDVFAAECLLPYHHFKRRVEDVEVSLDAIKDLAALFKVSLTSTGSRFAVYCNVPCTFVLMEDGKIRYVSSSKFMREMKGWINIGHAIPRGSVAYRLANEAITAQEYDEVPTDIWFESRIERFDVCAEEALFLKEWQQCLSLIWMDDSLRPTSQNFSQGTEGDETLLNELDGVLPWPSKKRRRP